MKHQTITSVFILFVLTLTIVLLAVIGGCNTPTETEYEEEIERSYTKTIERTYANEFERSLIDSAEAAYPPRDSVLAAVWPPSFQNLIPETGYWFYRSIEGVLMPFAITIDAVDYYSSVIDSMQAGVAYQYLHNADFEYRASVSFEETYQFQWPEDWDNFIRQMYIETGNMLPTEVYERVFVVKMQKSWTHDCTVDCYLLSSLVRIVIFDESLNLVNIYFDGDWWVPIVS